MNAQLFKKLIKQCVKEAMREELPLVLMEYQQRKPAVPVITEDMKPLFMQDPEETTTVRNELKNKMANLFGLDEPKPQSIPGIVNEEQTASNPYLSFIADSAKNMSPQDLAGLRNMG